ncbi:hypothetical protein [Alkalisalibacterium limincola]|uniref:Phytoene synthase n=1 Tax=Alkalisalibacterium limincola TaxID=2699169 RepID=A0A5C8KX59_9GAMM|nr:hypothetical protein [Alkalisalibacterium limincola]TXK65820.1 hypothetical protein FU658_01580 [Alkalisalibacterium limincola]
MGLVLRFVPAPQRESAVAWGALLSELRETAFEHSDARVTQAKAGWWAEELLRFGKGEARHPLGRDLPAGLPWVELATALARVAGEGERAADPAEAFEQIAPFADALARLEALWFGARPEPAAVASVAVHLLAQRLVHGRADDDAARVPMNLFARHGLTPSALGEERGEPVVRDWSLALRGHAPEPGPGMVVFRRLRAGLDREQLAYLQRHPGRPWQPGPLTVWRSWRLARAG